mmetsp:Transcript_31705/g.49622  ORF Transcript_31705/g.49622 Transcript_31705/m.49622 type:complete len:179 (-) Transcript_31705:1397-1933(-)
MSSSTDFQRYVGWLRHRVGTSKNRSEASNEKWRYAFLLENDETADQGGRRLTIRAFDGTVYEGTFSEADFAKMKSQKVYLETWKAFLLTIAAALNQGAVTILQTGNKQVEIKIVSETADIEIPHSFLLEAPERQDEAKNSFLKHMMERQSPSSPGRVIQDAGLQETQPWVSRSQQAYS